MGSSWIKRHSSVWIGLAVFLLQFQGVLGDSTYCSGTTTLDADSGVIVSHEGDDPFYKNDNMCIWMVSTSTSVESVSLVFNKMDLEYKYDYLRIYNGTNMDSAGMLTTLTGHTTPSVLEFQTPFHFFSIVFVADQLIPFTGFNISFYASTCDEDCGSNGHCIDGGCQCKPGYIGRNCSVSDCGDCSGHGLCRNGTCQCHPGFIGETCANRAPWFCSGKHVITAPSGTFTDHTGADAYKPNSNCTWSIETGHNSSFTMVLTKHQFERPDYNDDSAQMGDRLMYYEYFSGLRRLVNVWPRGSIGSFVPYPFTFSQGTAEIEFHTNSNFEYNGFEASFWSNDLCPESCNGKGYCIDFQCACFDGTSGSSCQEEAPIEPVEFNQTTSDFVSEYQWKYYSIELGYPAGDFSIDYAKASNGGHPEFFVQVREPPSIFRYKHQMDYYDLSKRLWVSPHENQSTWYLGVYGRQAANFTFTVNALYGGSPEPFPSESASTTTVDSSSLPDVSSREPVGQVVEPEERGNSKAATAVVVMSVSAAMIMSGAMCAYLMVRRRKNLLSQNHSNVEFVSLEELEQDSDNQQERNATVE